MDQCWEKAMSKSGITGKGFTNESMPILCKDWIIGVQVVGHDEHDGIDVKCLQCKDQ